MRISDVTVWYNYSDWIIFLTSIRGLILILFIYVNLTADHIAGTDKECLCEKRLRGGKQRIV